MKSRNRFRRSIVGVAVLASLSLIATACGSDSDDTSSETSAAAAAPTTEAPSSESTATEATATETTATETTATETTATESTASDTTAADAGSDTTAAVDSAEWDKIVEAAKEEGKVTIYSSQGLDQLNELGKRFKDEYGIDVEVFRAIDTDIQAKIQAERDSNSPIADFVVSATKAWAVEKSEAGWFTPVDLPAFADPGYNTELNISEKSDYFAAGGAVLTFGWNTELWPDGLEDYPDLLNPELKGKIGVIEPAAGSIVDFYLYLEDKYGTDFLDKLAAQEPRIYPSSLPMGEALISGEISAGSFVGVQTKNKADGAPVDSGLSDTVWGAIFNGSVLANAPHPNAALLLANYIITEPGQEAVEELAAAVLPDVKGTVAITTDDIRRQDLTKLTPEVVAAFQARFASLFH